MVLQLFLYIFKSYPVFYCLCSNILTSSFSFFFEWFCCYLYTKCFVRWWYNLYSHFPLTIHLCFPSNFRVSSSSFHLWFFGFGLSVFYKTSVILDPEEVLFSFQRAFWDLKCGTDLDPHQQFCRRWLKGDAYTVRALRSPCSLVTSV